MATSLNEAEQSLGKEAWEKQVVQREEEKEVCGRTESAAREAWNQPQFKMAIAHLKAPDLSFSISG